MEVIAGTLFQGSSNYFTDEVEFIRAGYEDEPEENLHRYRRESQLIFDRLYRRYPFDIILVPNDNYFFVRELIDIARGRGIPTVVLDKEGIITPHSFHSESRRARDFTPVIADHIFAWSHRQKLFWMRKGVVEDRITVVGQPRSDLLFLPPGDRLARYFDIERPLVTVFSYMDMAYMPLEYLARTKSSWRDMKSVTHAIVRDLADQYPDHNFVVKCHPVQRDLEPMSAMSTGGRRRGQTTR